MPKKTYIPWWKRATNSPAKEKKPSGRVDVQELWNKELKDTGWTNICNGFLDNYAQLGISDPEALLVIHLIRFKRGRDHPWPSYKRLGKIMQKDARTVRKLAKGLEDKGFLRRIFRPGADERSQTNLFDLTPLFQALTQRLQDVNES